MVTLTQLKYIVSVCKEKHFGRAAEKCNVSQPSLSTQIQKVEELLNIIIFDRSKKPIMTTEDGKVLIDKAKLILASVQDLEHTALNSNNVSGDFSLGVIPTLSPYLLPLFIESFSKNYPDVKLKVYEFTTEEILKKLYDDELDAGLLVTPLKDDKIIERALFSELFYLYTSEGHSLSSKASIDVTELNDREDFWVLSEGHCFRDQIFNICNLKGKSKGKGIFFESGSLETIKNLIKKGSGISVIPQLAAEDVKNRVIPFNEPSPAREVGLVYSRSFLKEKVIDALEKEILASLPKEIKNLKRGFQNIDFK
ncbi:MAG: hydrogen peroxide-inducible genes activator [Bdellovibrionales bacterium]